MSNKRTPLKYEKSLSLLNVFYYLFPHSLLSQCLFPQDPYYSPLPTFSKPLIFDPEWNVFHILDSFNSRNTFIVSSMCLTMFTATRIKFEHHILPKIWQQFLFANVNICIILLIHFLFCSNIYTFQRKHFLYI